MRSLILHKDGTFTLDQIDLGDYLEAEFIGDLGYMGEFEGANGPVAVRGFQVLLTFSNIDIPPEEVVFKTVSNMTGVPLFRGRTPGEKLVLRPVQVYNRNFTWHQLSINGAMMWARRKSKA